MTTKRTGRAPGGEGAPDTAGPQEIQRRVLLGRVAVRALELGLGDRLLVEDVERCLEHEGEALDEALRRAADATYDVARAREELQRLIQTIRADPTAFNRHPMMAQYLAEVELVDVLDSPAEARMPGATTTERARRWKWLQRGRALCVARGNVRVRMYLRLRQGKKGTT